VQQFVSSLKQFYSSPALAPGDPLHPKTLLGPLHSKAAVKMYEDAIKELVELNAEIVIGGSAYQPNELASDSLKGENFVRPTIVIPSTSGALKAKNDIIWSTETFAPILKIAVFDTIEEAIELNNNVPQGLSSSLWTRDMRNVGRWIGPSGSDCGIVNVSGRWEN
jgi:aldehyde dehydrogenase family 7 member A1